MTSCCRLPTCIVSVCVYNENNLPTVPYNEHRFINCDTHVHHYFKLCYRTSIILWTCAHKVYNSIKMCHRTSIILWTCSHKVYNSIKMCHTTSIVLSIVTPNMHYSFKLCYTTRVILFNLPHNKHYYFKLCYTTSIILWTCTTQHAWFHQSVKHPLQRQDYIWHNNKAYMIRRRLSQTVSNQSVWTCCVPQASEALVAPYR
jgi:hypothetical protein